MHDKPARGAFAGHVTLATSSCMGPGIAPGLGICVLKFVMVCPEVD